MKTFQEFTENQAIDENVLEDGNNVNYTIAGNYFWIKSKKDKFQLTKDEAKTLCDMLKKFLD